ncbi:MAG: DUF4132 domain-containing protein [Myxococcota bacterium]
MAFDWFKRMLGIAEPEPPSLEDGSPEDLLGYYAWLRKRRNHEQHAWLSRMASLPPERRRDLVLAAYPDDADGPDSAREQLVGRLLASNRRFPFDERQMAKLVRRAGQAKEPKTFVRQVERFLGNQPPARGLRQALLDARAILVRRGADPKFIQRIEVMLRRGGAEDVPLVAPGVWGTPFLAWLASLPDEVQTAWRRLFEHAYSIANRTRPDKGWLEEGDRCIQRVGSEAVEARCREIFPSATLRDAISDRAFRDGSLIRGLLFAGSRVATQDLAHVYGTFVETCFVKVKGTGPRNQKIGNAAIAALAMMPNGVGLAELTRLQTALRYASARTQVERSLERTAEAAGTTVEVLQDSALPDFDLDHEGTTTMRFGDVEAALRLVRGVVEVRWTQPNGKVTKGAPAAVKRSHPEAPRAVKTRRQAIESAVQGQRDRLDRAMWRELRWPWAQFKKEILTHPLRAPLANGLLWSFDEELGTVRGGRPVGLKGELTEPSRVTLWHPAEASDETVAVFRDWFLELDIRQPFPQLWRGRHAPTAQELEAKTSDRVAGHVLDQRRLKDHGRAMEWSYTLRDSWEGDSVASRTYGDVRALLRLEPLESGEPGIYGQVETGVLSLVGQEGASAPSLVSVRLWSEILRDVDELVARCTVANDPLPPSNHRSWLSYWTTFHSRALLPSAKARREALVRLLVEHPNASRLTLEDRHLAVQGKRHRYAVHLATAHIFIEPEHRALALPKAQLRKLFPPREDLRIGDATLAAIVGRAEALLHDDTIDHAAFNAQVGGGE